MSIRGITPNMTLVIEHSTYPACSLPWDLKTIFDCALSLEDVDTLQSGSVLQVGEIQMHLVEVDEWPN